MDSQQKKKLGDVLCDIGKYMLTVVPFSFFISDKPDTLFVIIGTASFGFLFILFGLYFVKYGKQTDITRKGQKKKIKVLKNSVFVVEEESDIVRSV